MCKLGDLGPNASNFGTRLLGHLPQACMFWAALPFCFRHASCNKLPGACSLGRRMSDQALKVLCGLRG